MDVLIKNANLLAMVDEEPLILNNINLYIKDSIIYKIWSGSDCQIGEDVKIFDAKNMLIMPGLINTHTHSAMSLFRGYNDERSLMSWLNEVIFPKEKLLTEEAIYWGALLSCIEMIKSGTTCFSDMYFKCKQIEKAVKKCRMRAFLSWSVCDNNVDDVILEAKEYIKNHRNDLIDIGFSLHSPYACSEETIKKIRELVIDNQRNLQIHLAETKSELEIIKNRYGKTPTEYLNDNGLLYDNTVLAHGIYLTDSDMAILKEKGCGISHNPISNCKLASGICDVVKLKNRGIIVGLGTDGQGSTTTLDMFEEMRVTGYLQKIKYENSNIIKAYDILKMATLNGAKILKCDDMIGSIEEGKKADLIFIDINEINLQPNNNICSNLVYSASGANVQHVMINGEFIMVNRKVLNIDEEKVIKNIRQISKNIL